eukprot:jgi/Botrbrau1/2479/Bobra.0226s0037.1
MWALHCPCVQACCSFRRAVANLEFARVKTSKQAWRQSVFTGASGEWQTASQRGSVNPRFRDSASPSRKPGRQRYEEGGAQGGTAKRPTWRDRPGEGGSRGPSRGPPWERTNDVGRDSVSWGPGPTREARMAPSSDPDWRYRPPRDQPRWRDDSKWGSAVEGSGEWSPEGRGAGRMLRERRRGPPEGIREDSEGQLGISQLLIGEAVYGTNPVLAALSAGRRQLNLLYIQEGLEAGKRTDGGAAVRCIQLAESLGLRVDRASKHDLNMICNNRPHQGLVLDAGPLDWEPLDEFPPAAEVSQEGVSPPLWLCLDQVVDPQNLGAAVRSAAYLGCAGVLSCARNSAPLSPAVSKASAGALEEVPLHSARNLPRTLTQAASAGWEVLGACTAEGAVNVVSYKRRGPAILVLGNEGTGLRTTVKEVCTALVKVEGRRQSPGTVSTWQLPNQGVDSLNVSVATGILLHHLLQQHG